MHDQTFDRDATGSAMPGRTLVMPTTTAVLAALVLAVPDPAAAGQATCGKRSELVERLAKTYKEAPVAVGLTSTGALIEVLTSGEGTTWTIIVSQPNGSSCLVAAGESWQELARANTGDLDI